MSTCHIQLRTYVLVPQLCIKALGHNKFSPSTSTHDLHTLTATLSVSAMIRIQSTIPQNCGKEKNQTHYALHKVMFYTEWLWDQQIHFAAVATTTAEHDASVE